MITMNNTYYDYEKTTRRGVKDNEGNTPRLVFGFANGNPRFNVYLGKDKGMAVFPSDHDTVGAILESLELMVKAEPGAKISFNSKAPDRDESGEPTGKMYTKSMLIVGKANSGEIFIRIEDPKKGTHPFLFGLSDYHDAFENGEDMVKSKTSALVTRAWKRLVSYLLATGTETFTRDKYDASDYKPGVMKTAEEWAKERQQGSGYNKGNYNKGGNSGGYNKPKTESKPQAQSGENAISSDFDDDIPF